MKSTFIKIITLITVITHCLGVSAQADSPYKTDLYTDGAWIIGGFALTGLGFSTVLNKDDLTIEELNNLSEDDIWGVDRWAAGNFSESASTISDIPFYASFATPFLFVLNEKTRKKAGQISVMYLEALTTTAGMFTLTAGLVDKSRPLVYNPNVDLEERLENDSQRSFYSGHVAASAASLFFAAQVFSDFFPNSKAKPYIWTTAAVVPAVIGYLRIESGKHFLSDTIIGYAIGAATGILIPRIHRIKNKKLKVATGIGFDSQTIGLRYVF